MARRTAAMVYRYAGGRYNHIWPDPATAPYATVSAVSTWTGFVVSDGTAAGITRHVAPLALLYFRWAAVVTWLAGAALLGPNFGNAFSLAPGYAGIGIGAWLGTIMLLNVWVLIWPNQQKILGMKPATDDEKNKARRIALLTSRANTMLSLPMLFFMAGGLTHKAAFGL